MSQSEEASSRLTVRIVGPIGRRHVSMDRFTEVVTTQADRRHADLDISPLTLTPRCRAATQGPERVSNYVDRWVRYPREAGRARGDVFHVTDHSYADLVAVLPSSRTVVTCHDLMLLVMATGELGLRPPRRWLAQFRRSIKHLSSAAVVVCVSETTRLDVLRFCDVAEDRLRVVPNGVDDHFVAYDEGQIAAAQRRLGLSAQPVILHVSSGPAYKNVETTLAVLARTRRAGIDALLVRVGVPLDAVQQQLADRLGVTSAIRDLGRVSESGLVDAYNAADLLLFPSLYEGFGLPVLESMACGTPVVASDIPPITEVLGGTGLQAPARDAGTLADLVGRALSEPDLATKLARSGRDRSTAYSWTEAVDAYAEIYRATAG